MVWGPMGSHGVGNHQPAHFETVLNCSQACFATVVLCRLGVSHSADSIVPPTVLAAHQQVRPASIPTAAPCALKANPAKNLSRKPRTHICLANPPTQQTMESIYNLVPQEYIVRQKSPIRIPKAGKPVVVSGSTFGESLHRRGYRTGRTLPRWTCLDKQQPTAQILGHNSFYSTHSAIRAWTNRLIFRALLLHPSPLSPSLPPGCKGTTRLPGAGALVKKEGALFGLNPQLMRNSSPLRQREEETAKRAHGDFKYTDRNKQALPDKSDRPVMGIQTSKNFITANAVEAILQGKWQSCLTPPLRIPLILLTYSYKNHHYALVYRYSPQSG